MNKKFKQLRQAFYNSFNMKSIIKKELVIQKYHEYAYYSTNLSLKQVETDIIVSLTTYNKRIFEVYLTIESLLQQTCKPKRIILWLSKDEFNLEEIPLILLNQKERGLEIRFCEDLKSYKKLIPTLLLYPDFTIITVDDDYIYPVDFIERLIKLNNKYPECICYYTGSRMSLDENKKIETYLQWRHCDDECLPSCLNFATGAGGILYPPDSFYKDVTNIPLFESLAPSADDVWFKAMTLMKGVKYVKVPEYSDFDYKFIILDNMQNIALYHRNVENRENDKQIKAVFEKYKLEDKLKLYE